MNENKGLIVFQDKKIRRAYYEDEWYFSIVDVINALTDSSRPRKDWLDLKNKLNQEGFEVSDIIGRLKLEAEDGKLIFTMLGEKVTTEITKKDDSEGFDECEDAAKRGGKVAGDSRKETEKEIGRPVSSKENYLKIPEKKKRKMIK